MKKIALSLLLLIVLLTSGVLGLAALAGFSPAYLYNAPAVATGIGAKLLCSSRYVSGLSEEQSRADLIQYSPILEYLTVDYDDEARRVEASLLGLRSASSSYLPGLGCAIDFDGYGQREQIEPHRPTSAGNSQRASGIKNIATSPAQAWPLGNEPGQTNPALQAELERQITQDNAGGLNTRALLVVSHGEIVAESYAQGAGPETPLLGWSMAKSLTSVMLGNQEMRGLVDLRGAPGFEQWADDERAAIRTEDLLTMTDGLDFSEVYDPGEDAPALLFTEPSASDYALSRPLVHEPGTHFHYSTGTANILSRLFYKKAGDSPQASYDDYIDFIHRPLGFRNSTFETDSSGVFAGGSYFYASARDWARIGQLMLNRGTFNGRRIVSEDWVSRAVSPNSSDNEPDYGYQWWLNRGDSQPRWPDLPADAFAARDNREQRVMVIPSLELVIVRLGWSSGSYPTNQRFREILGVLSGPAGERRS